MKKLPYEIIASGLQNEWDSSRYQILHNIFTNSTDFFFQGLRKECKWGMKSNFYPIADYDPRFLD